MEDRKEQCTDTASVPELSPAGKKALRKWNIQKWIFRGLATVGILAVLLAVCTPLCVYLYGVNRMNRGEFLDAFDAFYWLDGYLDSRDKVDECHYRWGLVFMESGDYGDARWHFDRSDEFRDSEALIDECNLHIYGEEKWNRIKSINVGDIYEMGTYEQDGITENGPEPIQWVVWKKEEYMFSLVSLRILDSMAFHTEGTAVEWRDITIREWLNGEFYKSSFTDDEMKIIEKSVWGLYCPVTLPDERRRNWTPNEEQLNNPNFDIEKWNTPTAYAVEKGLALNKEGEGSWWVFDENFDSLTVCEIFPDGTYKNAENYLDAEYIGVRPMIRINLAREE